MWIARLIDRCCSLPAGQGHGISTRRHDNDTLTTRLTRGILSAAVIALIAEFVCISRGRSSTSSFPARSRISMSIRKMFAARQGCGHCRSCATSSSSRYLGHLPDDPLPRRWHRNRADCRRRCRRRRGRRADAGQDIISGMFFLLDDAFRVGEYIQSGSYKGTVDPSACGR